MEPDQPMIPPPNSSTDRLSGKIAIVTGGASGIGESTARLFAQHGATIIIADIQDDKGRQIASEIGNHRCTYIHCDVTDEHQVKSAIDLAITLHGTLDIMFSNAGIFGSASQTIVDLDLNNLDRVYTVNVRGMAACVKHAARVMIERRVKGSVICTGSVMSVQGGKTAPDYTISKHAVLGLVRAASQQLGLYGIRVNCVSPFGVSTPMSCGAFGTSPEEMEVLIEPFTPLKGVVLKTKHVADAVLFLASDDSAFINGHNIVLDGGFTA
ncbi:short-chain dehydrogenase reductase 3b-like [Impatiens glandulifera]|uniref:short-chain dehydrogenase reductase 3b-like n=1 Tax=Impatiens glandulifera TaxID=253017 RepID=UPI001FB072BC|nr:short-chain dehydrogenase reductase 3b-like [Impatiens glandulifera]